MVHLLKAHLLPKLRCQFAEFLLQSSLKRLRILISRTSVGLRYGRMQLKLSGFSWKQGITHFGGKPPRYHASSNSPGFARAPSPTQRPGLPTPGQPSAIRPPIAFHNGAEILICFPSATHFCLALGADSPYADERCVGNLGLTARGPFTPFIATHVSIRTSDTSSSPYEPPSSAYGTLSYQLHAPKSMQFRDFGI